jgi:uncharacterized membrane protein YgaE (UPF0421/DUF939 family)
MKIGNYILIAVVLIIFTGIIASNVFAWKGSIVSGSITTTTTIIGLFVAVCVLLILGKLYEELQSYKK